MASDSEEQDDCWTGEALSTFLEEDALPPINFSHASVKTVRGRGCPRLPRQPQSDTRESETTSVVAHARPVKASSALVQISAEPSDDKLLEEKFGPIGSMPLVGSDLQKRMKNSLAHALKNKIDYHDPVIEAMFTHKQTSLAVLATFWDVTPSQVHRAVHEAGASAVHGGAWLAGAFICCMDDMIKEKLWRPIMYTRRLRYDETPSRIRLPAESTDPTNLVTGASHKTSDKQVLPAGGIDVATHAKVLQTELKLYFLLQDVSTKDYLLLTQSVPTALQAVDRTTAECTKACIEATIRRIPELTRVSAKFPFKVAHACTDAYPANIKTEKAFKCQDPEFVSHHLFCSVHKVATSIAAANSVFEDDVSGVLSVALACRDTGSCGKIQRLLADIFQEKLIIRPVISPHADLYKQYRDEVYDVFLPVGDAGGDLRYQNLKRRMVLSHFCNGNLQSKDIEHFCPFGHCIDENETKKCFAVYVAWALCPTKPPKYSRGRWTGYDRAVMWSGFLAAHHGLLEDVILRYTGAPVAAAAQSPCDLHAAPLPALLQSGGGEAPQSESDDDRWGNVLHEFLKECTTAPVGAVPLQQDDAHARDADDAGLGSSDARADGNGGPETSGFDWVEFNRRQKASAAAWVQTSPYPRLSILHQVCRHFLAVMHHFFKISGSEFERQQATLQAQGMQREYRVSDCAATLSLTQCLDSVFRSLIGTPKAVPEEHQTRNHRNLFFCMATKGACAVHQIVRVMHSSFPYRMFLALHRGWAELCEESECMLDELSSNFLKHFTKNEHREDATVALEALAICSAVDVAEIECRHATNRDLTMLRGSGWVPSLGIVSAKFACGIFKPGRARARRKVKNKILKKKSRPGGAWRAFLSERLSGSLWKEERPGASRMSLLAEEFRSLSAADKAYFVEIGQLATIAGQHGHKPFGDRRKQKKPEALPRTIPQGTVTQTGAIALGDGGVDLALVHLSERPFHETYAEFVT